MSRKTITLTCPICDREFIKLAKDIKSSVTCCSYACRGEYKRIHKNKVCSVCNNTFSKPSVYCSKECANKQHSQWVKENQSGSNNSFYGKHHTEETRLIQSKSKKDLIAKGWKPKVHKKLICVSKLSKDPSWKFYRRNALIRDNFTCKLCNGAIATHVHHIIPRKVRISHNINNLVSLCRKCHELTYGKELDFVDIFLGILRDANG